MDSVYALGGGEAAGTGKHPRNSVTPLALVPNHFPGTPLSWRARGGGTQRLRCETTGECTSWQSMAWRGSRLEEVSCGSFYTSACWPALVMMPIEPAPGPQSLCLPAGLSG